MAKFVILLSNSKNWYHSFTHVNVFRERCSGQFQENHHKFPQGIENVPSMTSNEPSKTEGTIDPNP